MPIDPFSDQPQNDDVTFDTLVGEDKKYRDENALAKAYANLEAHLEEVKRDNAQMRAKSDAEKNLMTDNNDQHRDDHPPVDSPKNQNNEDLRTQIREEFRNLSESQKFEHNVETTAQKLIDYFGDPQKANQAVKDRARELGVSTDWLRDSAARSPAAFYATMGITPEEPRENRETPANKSEIRVESNNKSGVKNYDYYNQLRKENKSLYFSQAVQKEMHQQAKELGDAFYA